MQSFKLLDMFSVNQSNPQQIKKCLKQNNVQYEQKVIRQSIHINSKQKGFEVQYKRNLNNPEYTLQSIFIYLKPNKYKFHEYPSSHPLPYKLYHKMTIKAVIFLLGQPIRKSKYSLQCMWSHLGIDIVFSGTGWTDQNATMQYICVYQAENQKDASTCCICHKKIMKATKKLGCTDCKYIFYCSQQCKQKHYRFHQMYCQSID